MSLPNDTLRPIGLPYEQPFEEVAAVLGVDLEVGLTSEQARERQNRYGLNVLQVKTKDSRRRRLLGQLRDPQVSLLLAAAVVSIMVSEAERASAVPYEALIILAIVVLNAVLGFAQEDRAERALASLKDMAPATTTVIRDGKQQRVLAQDLVPGDLLVIREGDRIPADARLVQIHSLQTAEASLTGESLPVLKQIGPVKPLAAVGDRLNMVFAGAMAISGNARAVVTATGMRTEFGRIAELLHAAGDPMTPLQKQLRHLSKQIGVAVVAIAAVVVATLLAVYGSHGADTVMDILIFGIALAVAATPEGLAAVITLVQAIGVQRMARRGAIIRRLSAVETLGSTTVIASDKTGTMTRNEMTVSVLLTASGETQVSGQGYSPVGDLRTERGAQAPAHQWQEVERLLLGASLANNAQLSRVEDGWTIQGDPTEGALLTAAAKAGILPSVTRSLYPRLAEIAFSSERKRMSTVHADTLSAGGPIVFTKGAPDIVLACCTHEWVAGGSQRLTPARRQEILRSNERLTEGALRTLAVGTRSFAPGEGFHPSSINEHEVEAGLTFLGLIGMMDPPRPEARRAVAQAREAGIRTILITGDHPRTAAAVARQLDIAFNDLVLSGAELERMSDADLAQAVRDTAVFARVHPEHKLRIVRALQQNGEIVAMTGDGVNDAPALKAAHIGIAMGITGTDVSKEAADLVLTDDNFATIVAAVEEGRIVFDNIQKFLRYLLATNLGEVLTIFLSAAMLSPRNAGPTHSLELPLSAAQILWINLVTDGAPALALGVDTASPGIMRRRPRGAFEKIISRRMILQLPIVSIVMAIGTLSIFIAALNHGSIQYARSTAFTTLILFQLFNSLSARSDSDSAFRNLFGNRRLWAAVLLSLGLQIILLSTPFLRRAFAVTSLSGRDWFVDIAVASLALWVSEAVKFMARRADTRRVNRG